MTRIAYLTGAATAPVGAVLAVVGAIAETTTLWRLGLVLLLVGLGAITLGASLLNRSAKKDISLIRNRTLRIEQQNRRTAAKVRLIEHNMIDGAFAQLPTRAVRIESAAKNIEGAISDLQSESIQALDDTSALIEAVIESHYDSMRLENRSLTEVVLTRLIEAQGTVESNQTLLGDVTGHLKQIQMSDKEALETLRLSFDDHYRQIESLVALRDLLERPRPLPALRDWAASPDLARFLVEFLIAHRPQAVVEIGSGSSTVLMAAALKANGFGHVYAVEHLDRFADQTRSGLADAHLDEWATVITAELAPVDVGGQEWAWYDIDFEGLPDSIGLLLVDGPPASVGEHARYPALPLLFERMADNGMVVLDDYHRPQEQEIAHMWMEAYPQLELMEPNHEKGTAVLQVTKR